MRTLRASPWIAGLLLMGALSSWAQLAGRQQGTADPLNRSLAAAERSLREGRLQDAEKHYRAALSEGWLLLGIIERAEERLPEAREAFRRASISTASENRRALQLLALAHLQMSEPAPALEILTRLARQDPKDVQVRRALAHALIANERIEDAVRELEEARATAPNDLELAYSLASGYLRLKRVEDAGRLFAEVAKGRPIAPTHVLIGRTYSDAGEFKHARVELRKALEMDPRARRAHYYLGMAAVLEGSATQLDEAIAEFRAELKLGPQDPLTNLQLGMALVEARLPAEALPTLEIAVRSEPPQARPFYYLGRAQLGLDRVVGALTALQRALELAHTEKATEAQLGMIHNQLGQALRKIGSSEEAAAHFSEAERMSAQGLDASRQRLARYLSEAPNSDIEATVGAASIDTSPVQKLAPAERADLRQQVTEVLARSYMNLGVMQTQGERFGEAAEFFEQAAANDPDFPQVQRSLGVARFSAKEFDKATEPLSRALAVEPKDASLKRMLAMSWLETEAYERAAELLGDDPERWRDPSLQFAYGLSLVHSGRAREAEAIFRGLLSQHGDWPELNVVLGQAHAQEGDFESAIRSLQRSLELKPDVAEAHGTLGVIYLKQGRLDEAESALRAELKTQPRDLKSQQNLAVVLDLQQRGAEALPLLRRILESKPDVADARYLLGKILLSQGEVAEAVEQLEAAARLAPDDANVRYQLGRAYQGQGRPELAQQEFETFRQLKAKR